MTGAAAIRRQEYAVAAAVLTAALVVLVVALDAVRFHLPAVLKGEHAALDLHTGTLLALIGLEAAVLWRIGVAARTQAHLQRRLQAMTVLGQRDVAGLRVDVVPGDRPLAFCAGLIRPRVRVSYAALSDLDPVQLRAIVAHELAHVRRRDPLRLAVAQAVADGFWFVPPFRHLTARQAAAADLAADAAAVRAAGGSPRSLASAMLAVDDPAPERVDQLLGRPLRVVPTALLVATLAAILVLLAVAGLLALTATDPAVPGGLLALMIVPAALGLWMTDERVRRPRDQW